MAMIIKASTDKVEDLSHRCKVLADKYGNNMRDTEKILDMVDDVWSGAEQSACIQKLKISLVETGNIMRALNELSNMLEKTGELMRNAEQMTVDQVRNHIDF